MNCKKRQTFIDFLFILSIFTLYLIWAIIQPFDTAPDEMMRYQIPKFIFENGCLPHGGDESIRNPIWGISYGFTPITSYIISALFMKITSLFSNDFSSMFFSARLVSTLCETAMVAICIPISKKLFKNEYIRWMFLLLVALLPQAAFMAAYINVDAFTLLSTAIIVYAWIRGLETDWNIKSCILLSVGVSMCSQSYYNAYGFILCSVIIFLASSFILRNNKSSIKKILYKIFIMLLIFFLLSGWWFIRNYVIYDGDIFGFKTSNEYAELYAIDKYKPSQIETPSNSGQSLYFMLVSRLWILLTARSFIGCLGTMNIALFNWMYLLYFIIFFAGILGCFFNIKHFFPLNKSINNYKKTFLFNLTMFIAMLIPNIINIYYSYTCDFQPQGRYSLPMLIPFMYFISYGIDSLISKFIKNVKLKKIIPITINFSIILIAILCITNIVIPAYYR